MVIDQNPGSNHKRKSSEELANENKLLNGNRFSSLQNNVEAPNNPFSSTMTKRNESPISTSKFKPPPITIFGQTALNIRNELQEVLRLKMTNIVIKPTQFGIKVYAGDKSEHTKIIEHFRKMKTELFTHVNRDEKNTKVCLYGLWKMPTDELLNELERVGITPKDAKIIEPRSKKYDDQVIYVLYFNKSEKIKIENLRLTRALLNCIVRWDYYMPKNRGPTQCANCLAYGHGTQNCFRSANCIRCGGKHKSDQCPHLPDKESQEKGVAMKIPPGLVKCANCQGRHTANYSGCVARKTYTEIQNKVRQKNNAQVPTQIFTRTSKTPTRKVTPNISFRDMLVQNNKPHEELFSPIECSNMMAELLEKLSRCQNKYQQIQTITDFTLKHLYGNK